MNALDTVPQIKNNQQAVAQGLTAEAPEGLNSEVESKSLIGFKSVLDEKSKGADTEGPVGTETESDENATAEPVSTGIVATDETDADANPVNVIDGVGKVTAELAPPSVSNEPLANTPVVGALASENAIPVPVDTIGQSVTGVAVTGQRSAGVDDVMLPLQVVQDRSVTGSVQNKPGLLPDSTASGPALTALEAVTNARGLASEAPRTSSELLIRGAAVVQAADGQVSGEQANTPLLPVLQRQIQPVNAEANGRIQVTPVNASSDQDLTGAEGKPVKTQAIEARVELPVAVPAVARDALLRQERVEPPLNLPGGSNVSAETSALLTPSITESVAPSRSFSGVDISNLKAPAFSAPTQSAGNAIKMMLSQGVNSATVSLHPAELGSMRINIDMRADQLQVQIVAVQPATRETIEATIPRLREHLEAEGFSGVSIDLGSGAAQDSPADSAAYEPGAGGKLPDADGILSQSLPDQPVNVSSSSRNIVDLFA
jgi:flagellar hook-length control protein FliK